MLNWDKNKSEANRETRGFGFETALDFDFATARTSIDERKDYGEVRYRAFNRIGDDVYMVAFTIRDKQIRIISMRRVHEKEAKRYGL